LQQAGLRKSGGFELHFARVRKGSVTASGIRAEPHENTALSDDGTRVAVDRVRQHLTKGPQRSVEVFDLDSGRLLASASGHERGWNEMFFVTPNVVRLIENVGGGPGSPMRIFELDVRTRSMTKTGELSLAEGWRNVLNTAGDERIATLALSGDGSRILVRGEHLLDGRTAQPITRLQLAGTPTQRTLLYDGTVVVASTGADGSAGLQIFSRDGQPQRALSFPGVPQIFVAVEIDGGKLILITRRGHDGVADGQGKMIVLDWKSGRIERTMNDVRGPLPRLNDRRMPRYAADQPLVALNAQGKLVTWDWRTGVVRRMPM
jgi:hypothetical protein